MFLESLFQPIFISILIISIIFLIIRPSLVLPIFIASIPFQSLSVSTTLTIPKILGFVALVAFILVALKEKIKIKLDLPFWILFLFLIWGALSYFWSIEKSSTITRITTVTQLLILYFLMTNQINNLFMLDKTLTFMFWGALLFALFSLGDLLLSLSSGELARLASIAKNANEYFIYAICLIPAIFWMIKTKNKLLKILSIFVLLILFVTSVYTQSRGGLISLGIFVLVVLFFSKRKASFLFVILLAVLFLIQISPPEFFERFLSINTDNRIAYLWPAGLRAFNDNLLIGSGLGTNAYLLPVYAGWGIGTGSVHSGFLAIGIETGVIGLMLYLSFILIPLLNLFYKLKSGVSSSGYLVFQQLGVIIFAVIVAIMASWVKGGGMEYSKLIWVMVGFASVFSKILHKYFST